MCGATIAYLLEQNHSTSTWTLCTGVMGDFGMRAAPAFTQGALYSLANVACRDSEETNVRFNEIYIALRVEVDESAQRTGFFKASAFDNTFQEILTRPEIQSSRISVMEKRDMTELKFQEKKLELVFRKDD
ncbi:hypothetical protein ASPZODRAFT_138535 [Penicilliopsis zonata CBS 506.65]|uniref:Uncharacterized protein n=1 Tax=Penicilliopsis zonata CBS 506.65 TaxID=1073090 RepID=A0A1L9SWG1_9EURO|nr:hypothetical protein ASPZODRAFT_138535 [Penicilliopsis zonata CBS 506.65]OJJ51441.1 hypothetical protein ASPZODRAFT_138535 [Penicilliopsis zonata CBS 506.65]